MSRFVPPRPLGVGLTHQRGFAPAISAARDLIDFLEVSPDLFCREREVEGRAALELRPGPLAETLAALENTPVVIHGLSLSIGSASGWNDSYVWVLDEFHSLRRFRWHSEHLGFMIASDPHGRVFPPGVPLPLPFTREAVALVAPRAAALVERYGVPFLIENLTYYLPDLPADPGWDEIVFLNTLTECSGCGLLLDLYNFHCNAVNFGFDPRAALDRLRLDRVVEIHLAGGTTHDGYLLDVHSDVIPEPVWDLFAWLAPRLPNLAGVVYELLEQALPIVGVDRVRRQLERIHELWARADQVVHVAS
jgi:uncharacterized protein (UPF0276 family)